MWRTRGRGFPPRSARASSSRTTACARRRGWVRARASGSPWSSRSSRLTAEPCAPAPRPGIHPLMRMSRERIFFLAERIMKELGNVPGVTVKSPDDVRPEIIRVLTDESKLEESVDTEVRKTLASYARPMPEGSHEWEVLYEKTREEVFRRRFRL